MVGRHIRWGDLIARAARPMIESAAMLRDASDASWRGPAIGSIGRPARAQPAWAAFSGGVDDLSWRELLRYGAEPFLLQGAWLRFRSPRWP
jgi:hypothetical protein